MVFFCNQDSFRIRTSAINVAVRGNLLSAAGIILLLGLTISAAGCGNDDSRKSGETSGVEGPVSGGTAVVALSSDPDVLNPLLYTSSNAGFVFAELHDGLTEMDEDLVYQPRIASRWEVSPDGRFITYFLRPWVWSDGHALNSRDVVSSFNLFADSLVASPRRGFFRDVLSATALDSAHRAA